MRHLAHTVAYDFDDLDWGAVETGLTTTDAEQARWFDYPLVGNGNSTWVLRGSLTRTPSWCVCPANWTTSSLATSRP
jgi:hypothetical protein